ncbi:MAG: ABC transporter ATP-binding protein, partial [Chloroflexota bacterium]|nr:ABC transporter ATP-binding protein [Chloroflexota bacterium]
MSIILEQLTKRYEGHPVVNNVSLEVGDGELFVLLGSSGSGKTTVLSMIAGLTGTDEGRILLHGRDVTHLPTQQRHVGYVFQNYALFQHMSVADNIEFGLRVRKVATGERRRRRDELLDLVGLSGLGSRLPRQISGGQQQRVALARALAHNPDVLLLDEPLGALDAKIRIELRRTLKVIQRELGIATILVTHDQEEAFELADRLGVMSFGRLLEVGHPQTLY